MISSISAETNFFLKKEDCDFINRNLITSFFLNPKENKQPFFKPIEATIPKQKGAQDTVIWKLFVIVIGIVLPPLGMYWLLNYLKPSNNLEPIQKEKREGLTKNFVITISMIGTLALLGVCFHGKNWGNFIKAVEPSERYSSYIPSYLFSLYQKKSTLIENGCFLAIGICAGFSLASIKTIEDKNSFATIEEPLHPSLEDAHANAEVLSTETSSLEKLYAEAESLTTEIEEVEDSLVKEEEIINSFLLLKDTVAALIKNRSSSNLELLHQQYELAITQFKNVRAKLAEEDRAYFTEELENLLKMIEPCVNYKNRSDCYDRQSIEFSDSILKPKSPNNEKMDLVIQELMQKLHPPKLPP